jgi:hypothetical protein
VRRTIAIIAVAIEIVGAAVYLWHRNPRIGAGFVDSVAQRRRRGELPPPVASTDLRGR